jgi:hypothetical protein
MKPVRLAMCVMCLLAIACGREAGLLSANDDAASTPPASVAPAASASPSAGANSDAADKDKNAAGAADEGSNAGGAEGSSAKPSPTWEPKPISNPPAVVASPACVVRGGTEKVTIETAPLADVTYGVSFSDGKNHDLYGVGQADDKGIYVWRFVVPLTAADGKATVLAAASHPEKGGGGATAEFTVASGAC